MNCAAINATPGTKTPFGKLSVEKRGKMYFTCLTDHRGRKQTVAPLNHDRPLFSSMCGKHWYSQQALFDEIDRREEMAEAMQKREHRDQGRDFERAITAAVMRDPDGKTELFRRLAGGK